MRKLILFRAYIKKRKHKTSNTWRVTDVLAVCFMKFIPYICSVINIKELYIINTERIFRSFKTH